MARRKKTIPEPVIETVEAPVPETEPRPSDKMLKSLQPGQYFEVDGGVYKLDTIIGTVAKVIFTEWAPSGKFRIDKYSVSMPLEMMVKPI